MSVRILGISIDDEFRDAQELVRKLLDEQRPHRIVTVNPEILLEAERNPAYRELIQTADVRTADGVGVVIAALLRGRRIRRITGSDLLNALLSVASEKKLRVFIAMAKTGLSHPEDFRLGSRFRGNDIVCVDLGVGERASDEKADIVIANFGAPLQEQWLAQSVADFPKARVFVGVGGAIDYFTEKVRRAPLIVRAVGLEWLWRLLRQPRRIRRIYNAVVKFPYKLVITSAAKQSSL